METAALLVGADGSRDEETYGADGSMLKASVTQADGSRSETTYGAGGQVLTASATRSDQRGAWIGWWC